MGGILRVLVQGPLNFRLKNVGHLGPDQSPLIGISNGEQLQGNTNTIASDISK